MATSFKVQFKVLNNKGQGLLEFLVAMQALLALFGGIVIVTSLSWNHLVINWISHEALICTTIPDLKQECTNWSHQKIKELTWFIQKPKFDLHVSRLSRRSSFIGEIRLGDLFKKQIHIEQELPPKFEY